MASTAPTAKIVEPQRQKTTALTRTAMKLYELSNSRWRIVTPRSRVMLDQSSSESS